MRDVLVVTVPQGVVKPEDFGKFREYVIESILRDVLVLDTGMSMEVRQLPEVGELLVEEEQSKPAPTSKKPTIREEKQVILSRLMDRRQKLGAGAFNDVARECRPKGVTADVLRLLVAGDATLAPHEWRAIGTALDRLEKMEREIDSTE